MSRRRIFLIGLLSHSIRSATIALFIGIILLTLLRVLADQGSSAFERNLKTFPSLFLLLFGLSLYALGIWRFFQWLGKTDKHNGPYTGFEKRVRQLSVDTRISIARSLKWTSYFGLLTFLVGFFLSIRELLVGDFLGEAASFGIRVSVLSFYIAGFCAKAASFVMNSFDWMVEYLQSYQRHKASDDLKKALLNYNRILGSTLSIRKGLEISQYVQMAYKIGGEKASKVMDKEITALTMSSKARKIEEMDKALITLYISAEKILSNHQKRLGLRIRHPIRLRISEQMKNAFGKIFPQLMLITIWLVTIIILMHIGIITLPPTLP